LIYFLHEFTDAFSPLRVFRYITVRAFGAAATSFLVCVIVGPWVIARLRRLKLEQVLRKEEAAPLYDLHEGKKGTPTMGGLIIIAGIMVSTVLWARPDNAFIWLALGTLCFMGGVGFLDDWLKIVHQDSRGLRARHKLALQLAWAVVAVIVMAVVPDTRKHMAELMVPFLKDPVVNDLGMVFTFLFVALVLIGASNAVNLTDGLDGLAIGCTSTVAMAYLVLSYVAGHAILAEYLLVPHVSGSGELAVICGGMLGAALGFLWFNCHPAQVFMGDTGSLALGGTIGMIAILIKQELLLVIVGGVFVMEALSVIIQVVSFRLRGKRVFAMAPVHHHFELRQWSETQVTIRFWIISIIFALLGVLSLKIR
jgi:phospho-N-acetylmuramoyl-pentapeptide-transferase